MEVKHFQKNTVLGEKQKICLHLLFILEMWNVATRAFPEEVKAVLLSEFQVKIIWHYF